MQSMPLRKMTRLRSNGVLITLLALAGCQLFNMDVAPGQVLFQDEFSLPSSGWDRYQDDAYLADYDAGEYKLVLYTPQTLAWSVPGIQLQDGMLRGEARRAGGPEDNLFGLICRYQGPGDFIFFAVASDGYAGIGRFAAGQRMLLSDESLLPTGSLVLPDGVNIIEADCVDERLTLRINGVEVAHAKDPAPAPGDVGLLAGAYEQAGVEIRFDRFSALQP